ncbi:MAG: hypothetical protein QOD63_2351, partial [Actinomycetota bacterium]|nr:hypothetical protein [Actinomycetota bacterium]
MVLGAVAAGGFVVVVLAARLVRRTGTVVSADCADT